MPIKRCFIFISSQLSGRVQILPIPVHYVPNMTKNLLYSLLLASTIIVSCKKDETSAPINDKDISNLIVPSNFNWQTAREVKFSIGIHDTRFQNKLHVIEVYVNDPALGGKPIAKGAASIVNSFKFKAEIPAGVTGIFLVKTAPDGSTVKQQAEINALSMSLSIGSTSITQPIALTAIKRSPALAAKLADIKILSSPNCNTSCTTEIGNSRNEVDLNGETYCLTGSNMNVNFRNINSGTIRICGTNVTVNNLRIKSGVTVIVSSSASVTFQNLNWETGGDFQNFGTATVGNVTSTGTLYNAGTLTTNDFTIQSGTTSNTGTIMVNGNTKVNGTLENAKLISTREFNMENTAAQTKNSGTINTSGNINLNGTFTNAGELNVGGVYNSNSKPTFTNSGNVSLKNNMTIAGTFTNSGNVVLTAGEINLNSSPTVTNSGNFTAIASKMNASGNVTNGGTITLKDLTVNSGKITNNCKLFVTNAFDNNAEIVNNSYIQVNGSSNLKGTFRLHNGAMFQTNSLDAVDGTVEGTGTTSLFKVVKSSSDNVNNNGVGKFKGTFVYCDPSRTIKESQFTGEAKQSCDVYIPTSNCNPVGNGTAPGPVKDDSDGDGVIDIRDDYPNDPLRAFKNYSCNYENGGSTLAFEDSWPLKGDYDLNDVVMTYRYLVATNNANKVVKISAEYNLIATGGEFSNGAGVQFNLPAASAKDFSSNTGAKLEAGQDSVVVTLFSNTRTEQGTWNTIVDQPESAVKNYAFSFDVANGPTLEAFGLGTYNPFIWNSSKDYGRGYETHLYGKRPTNLADATLFGTKDDNSKAGKYYSTENNFPWGIALPTAPFVYPREQMAITDAYLYFKDWATSGGNQKTDWYFNADQGYRETDNLYIRK